MFEYASSDVRLTLPLRVQVSRSAPSTNSRIGTIAATRSPGSMPTKFTIARPREVRVPAGISYTFFRYDAAACR